MAQITIPQAAELVGKSTAAICNWIRENLLEATRLQDGTQVVDRDAVVGLVSDINDRENPTHDETKTETLQLQYLGGGKYALPAGWKIENGTLVKANQLPKSMQDVVANYDADIYLSDRYNEIQTAAFTLLDLLVLRDIYNAGWKPNWDIDKYKQTRPHIFFNQLHKPECGTRVEHPILFVFKDIRTCVEFYDNFQKELQTIAKLLM